MRVLRQLPLLPVALAATLQLGSITYAPNAAASVVYTTYSFSQSGWVDALTRAPVAGTLSITFEGSDPDGNGTVAGGAAIGVNCVSTFSMSWSGNTALPAFTSLFSIFDSVLASNLTALLYDVGEGDFNGGLSFVATPQLLAGQNFVCDPSVILCGNLTGLDGVSFTTTRAPASVPEPGSLALLALAGAISVLARRSRKASN